MWALMWTYEVQFGKVRSREHLWVEAVLAYWPDAVDIMLGNDQSTVVEGVPYSELTAVRIG